MICTKRLRLDTHPATIHFWATLVAALSLAPFLVLVPRAIPKGPAGTAGVLCVGIVFTGVSGLVYITLLGRVTAQAAGLLAFLEPVSASFLAWALLGERLTVAVVLGGFLVLAAGTLVVLYEPGDAAAVEAPGLGSTSECRPRSQPRARVGARDRGCRDGCSPLDRAWRQDRG